MNDLDVKQKIGTLDFDKIISPYTKENFVKTYWEKQVLIIERNDPDYYKSLFSIEQVDRILDLNRPKGVHLRVVKNQEPLLSSKFEKADGSINLNQIYLAYANGYTIVINRLEQFWQPLKVFCQNLSNTLSHHSISNMYLTPQNQKALLPHYDTHDVYILQIHGKKHWRIYDSPMETPLLKSHQPIFKREQLRNQKEITIKAGDLMYMPRGVPHEAYTTDESSLHITVGVYPAQWVDLLTNSIQQASSSIPELRKSLPFGYLNTESWTAEFIDQFKSKFQTLLEKAVKENNIQQSIFHLSEEQRNKQTPIADGHFHEIDKINQMDLNSRLRKRLGLNSSVHIMGNVCRIIFAGNIIKGPAHIARTLQYISDAPDSFILKDLPSISDTNKIKLAIRLIKGGLLRFAD